jgi:hypothetical protein
LSRRIIEIDSTFMPSKKNYSMYTYYITPYLLLDKSGTLTRQPSKAGLLKTMQPARQVGVEEAGEAPTARPNLIEEIEVESSSERGGSSSCAEEPWVTSPGIYAAPPTPPGAFSVQAGSAGKPAAVPGFLGKAVGKVHENLEYWK